MVEYFSSVSECLFNTTKFWVQFSVSQKVKETAVVINIKLASQISGIDILFRAYPILRSFWQLVASLRGRFIIFYHDVPNW